MEKIKKIEVALSKEEIDRRVEEWNADKQKVIDAFGDFSAKYRDNIASVTLYSLGDKAGIGHIDIQMNGKFLIK